MRAGLSFLNQFSIIFRYFQKVNVFKSSVMNRKIKWDPNNDSELEDLMYFHNLPDKKKWESMMKLIHLTRKTPITFKKRIIKWK